MLFCPTHIPCKNYRVTCNNFAWKATVKILVEPMKRLIMQPALSFFGEAGTNGQHSFYQLLHQGNPISSHRFYCSIAKCNDLQDHHASLFANALSQSKAFMEGNLSPILGSPLPHKILNGNRPSNMILLTKLTPSTLGQLLALYEHKTFVESVIWDINAFDQWGVERGKELAEIILNDLLTMQASAEQDSSTKGLIKKYLEKKV